MVITEWTEGEPSDKVENLPIPNQVEDHTHIRDPRSPNYELQEVAIAVKKKPPPLEPLVCPPTPNVNPPVLPSPVRPPTADIPLTSMSNPLIPTSPTRLAPALIPSSNSTSTSAPPVSLTSPEHPPLNLFEPYVPPVAHPAHVLCTEHGASAPVRPSVSEPIMVKKMDLYGEGLDFVFSFGIEKLKLIFVLVMCVSGKGSCALTF